MTTKARLELFLKEVSHHLHNELIPFWMTHGEDKEYGGFLTYLDRNGNPTGETLKTLICQTRMIYTASSAHRAGLGGGYFLDSARQGVEFLIKHFWDHEFGGWIWTTERDGTPVNQSKIGYGQSFGIYCLSEYARASNDPRGLEWALKTYQVLQTEAADNYAGGYYEFLERDWAKKRPGVYGGDRKSYDVHMHLMEAFTNLYAATGNPRHKERTLEVIRILFDRVMHPEFGTGIAQFSLDWKPLRAILFKDVWGADRDVDDEEGRPMNNTSFGHNVEFAWLFLLAVEVLGLDIAPYKERLRKIFDHCVTYGIDWNKGGVFCEGPHDGPARERNKEFWQQSECLTGLMDAYLLFGDEKYLDAYENVHRFVMDVMINHEVGEWWPLFDENNNLIWDHMAHAWKINYHTVRSMILTEARLKKALARL
ncbi:MAG TPA: AGE family epimerase/isomerase [Candidatus Hydrogenedentes bacterium]|nr:AGE family epimerase/isomerase [Candidatus Hydrogenedentota bacterium]HPC16523.1 AGE family epimerase/isomerase [Candidatus Hydrogenedentota bacterium]HRT18978.1 AGE family epimerase/isomerase [Candidatus Hydrogenedentota bacterium]HRT65666.1 AGE family epimerase/isomerase [Candidatus Hydrogenedentota bacterium]